MKKKLLLGAFLSLIAVPTIATAHDGQSHLPENPVPSAPAAPSGPTGTSGTDLCPSDSTKNLPGVCGCGVADTDGNKNGIFDCIARIDVKSQLDGVDAAVDRVRKRGDRWASRAALKASKLSSFVRKWKTEISLSEDSTTATTQARKVVRLVDRLVTSSNVDATRPKSQADKAIAKFDSLLNRYQLFLGTGEYSPRDTWDAVLRFDAADSLVSGVQSVPSGTVQLKQTKDLDNVNLNFGHAIAYSAARDQMYVASLFTTTGDAQTCQTNQSIPCGSIGVMNKASQADGGPTLARHIFGSATTLNQPHGIFLDELRNSLYVANTFAGNLLVYDDASEAHGNQAPSRTLSATSLGFPVHVFLDSVSDILFVVSMRTNLTQKGGAVLIFNNASALTGSVTPNVRLFGPNSRLDAGNNQTTHNVWYDTTKKLLFVGHHTNEVLIYDMSAVDLGASGSRDIDLAPRILKINERSDDSDQYDWSAYGLFYLAGQDRLYVSAGNTVGGTPTRSGPPNSGATTHVVRVYDGISDPSKSGLVSPSTNIYWNSVTSFYPPQPLWVVQD